MPERDCAAVYVYLLAIQTEFFFDGEILRRKCFIYFDEIDVIKGHAGFLQCDLCGWNRAAAHDLGIDTCSSPAHDTAERLHIPLSHFVQRHHNDGRSAIDDAAGIARGDSSILPE